MCAREIGAMVRVLLIAFRMGCVEGDGVRAPQYSLITRRPVEATASVSLNAAELINSAA